MVQICVVCGAKYSTKNSVSFHSFPTNENYKKLWMEACNISSVNKQSRICSRHFSSSHFKTWNKKHGRRLLKNNVVPLLFLGKNNIYLKRMTKQSASIILPDSILLSTSDTANIVEPIYKEEPIEKEEMKITSPRVEDSSLSVCKTTDTSTLELNESEKKDINTQQNNMELILSQKSCNARKIWHPARVGDCTDEHFSTPRCAKHCFNLAVRKLFNCRKQLDDSRNRIKKLQLKVQTLEDLFGTLRKKQLISESVAQMLQAFMKKQFHDWH